MPWLLPREAGDVMTVYDLAGLVTGVLFFAACLWGLRWADKPAEGSRWDSGTYGPQPGDVSFLDRLDWEHRNQP